MPYQVRSLVSGFWLCWAVATGCTGSWEDSGLLHGRAHALTNRHIYKELRNIANVFL